MNRYIKTKHYQEWNNPGPSTASTAPVTTHDEKCGDILFQNFYHETINTVIIDVFVTKPNSTIPIIQQKS